MGISKNAFGRCDGRHRLGHPHRHARARRDAHPAARQRRHQRGMDFRQDPPHRRWFENAAPRPPLRARERQAARRVMGGGVCRHRRQGEGRQAGNNRRDRRRSRHGRRNVRAARPDGQAWLAQSRLPPGWLEAAPRIRARLLHLQRHHRGHRRGGCDHGDRVQPATRIARAQRPHPQALAQRRRAHRPDWRKGGFDLSLQLPGRRTGLVASVRGPRPRRQKGPDVDSRPRRLRPPRRRGRAGDGAQSLRLDGRDQGRLERILRASHRRSPGRRP